MELLKPPTPEPEGRTLRYSVRRARTEDERAQLVEHVGAVTPVTPARPPQPRWRVEVADDHVTLRQDGVAIELPIDEARRLAETILRHR